MEWRRKRSSPGSPRLRVEDTEYVLAGHEALLHIANLQVVQWEHVLLLLLLQMRKTEGMDHEPLSVSLTLPL